MPTDQTTPTQPAPTILSADEIAVINAARAVCTRYAERLRSTKWDRSALAQVLDAHNAGRVSAMAEVAEDALFQLLNHTDSYLHAGLTREQLHSAEHYAPTGRTIPGDLRLVPVA